MCFVSRRAVYTLWMTFTFGWGQVCVAKLGTFAILNAVDICQYFFAKMVQYLANFHLVLCKSFNRLD